MKFERGRPGGKEGSISINPPTDMEGCQSRIISMPDGDVLQSWIDVFILESIQDAMEFQKLIFESGIYVYVYLLA